MHSLHDGAAVLGSFESAANAVSWLRDRLRVLEARLRLGRPLPTAWLLAERVSDFEQAFADAVRARERDDIRGAAAAWIRFRPNDPVPYLLQACAAASLPKKGDAEIARLADEYAQRFAALPATGGRELGQDHVMADLERCGVLLAFRDLGLQQETRFDAEFFKQHRKMLLYVYPQSKNLDRKRVGVQKRLEQKRELIGDTQATIEKYERNVAKLRQQAQGAPSSSRTTFLNEARLLASKLERRRALLPRHEDEAREMELEVQRIDACRKRMLDIAIR